MPSRLGLSRGAGDARIGLCGLGAGRGCAVGLLADRGVGLGSFGLELPDEVLEALGDLLALCDEPAGDAPGHLVRDPVSGPRREQDFVDGPQHGVDGRDRDADPGDAVAEGKHEVQGEDPDADGGQRDRLDRGEPGLELLIDLLGAVPDNVGEDLQSDGLGMCEDEHDLKPPCSLALTDSLG